MTANASTVARGLLRRIGSCSPSFVGLVTGAGGAAALYALHACIEGQLDTLPHIGALPEIDGCHCWLVGIPGFAVGALIALLIAVVRRLLEPLVGLICESLLHVLPRDGQQPVFSFGFPRAHPLQQRPLARRLASRAPPIAI